jgi:magnesium and cobalt exporter, CNNM family
MQYSLGHALLALFLSFALCAFCAASETGLFSLNRYRLRHRAKHDTRAKRLHGLLSHPDKILGAILIGSVFGTAIASTVAHEICVRYWGEIGAIAAPFVLTVTLLVFAEVTPKTMAALKPEFTAYAVTWPLQIMLWLLYPAVWIVGNLSTLLLRLFGIVPSHKHSHDPLNLDELKTIVNETNALISPYHQDMLLGILNLEKIRVEHIMIPRNEVVGINLSAPEKIKPILSSPPFTLLPVYREDLDNVLGILHTRLAAHALLNSTLQEGHLLGLLEDPYFVPEGTSLYKLLLNFQRDKKRIGLVVDEYGDVLGLVTLDDIVEEIVGDFKPKDVPDEQISLVEDGMYLVNGSMSVRELNKIQHWHLPTDGPNTLSGLIIETLEAIPTPKTCLTIQNYQIEIVQMKDTTVKTVRIREKKSPTGAAPERPQA